MLVRAQRVGSGEYFDRYFHLGIVPTVDIADQTVRDAMVDYEGGQDDSPALLALLAAAAHEEANVPWKVLRTIESGGVSNVPRIVRLLVQIRAVAGSESGLSGVDRLFLEATIGMMLRATDPGDVGPLLDAVAIQDFDFAIHLARTLLANSDEDPAIEALAGPARQKAIELLTAKLVQRATEPFDDESLSLLLSWHDFVDEDEAAQTRSWLWGKMLLDEASPWQLEHVLALSVPVEHDGIDPRPTSGNKIYRINTLLGAEKVGEMTAEDVVEPASGSWDNDTSMENRTRHALLAVRHHLSVLHQNPEEAIRASFEGMSGEQPEVVHGEIDAETQDALNALNDDVAGG